MSARAIKARENVSFVLFFKLKDLPTLCGHYLMYEAFLGSHKL
jgi:hypothetical protein